MSFREEVIHIFKVDDLNLNTLTSRGDCFFTQELICSDSKIASGNIRIAGCIIVTHWIFLAFKPFRTTAGKKEKKFPNMSFASSLAN